MNDREQLRAALVERAMETWLPDAWGDIRKDKPSVAARLRKDMGHVIDALGVVEMAEALGSAIQIADEARREWDAAPSGMRAGKVLIALAGGCKGYRADIDKIHAALARVRGEPGEREDGR